MSVSAASLSPCFRTNSEMHRYLHQHVKFGPSVPHKPKRAPQTQACPTNEIRPTTLRPFSRPYTWRLCGSREPRLQRHGLLDRCYQRVMSHHHFCQRSRKSRYKTANPRHTVVAAAGARGCIGACHTRLFEPLAHASVQMLPAWASSHMMRFGKLRELEKCFTDTMRENLGRKSANSGLAP
jgi:hypothetical protein